MVFGTVKADLSLTICLDVNNRDGFHFRILFLFMAWRSGAGQGFLAGESSVFIITILSRSVLVSYCMYCIVVGKYMASGQAEARV